MGDKERIDILLVEKGSFDSREKAKRALMSGIVFVNGQIVDKAGTKVDIDSDIDVRGKGLPYVSRGGFKLEQAIKEFSIDLTNKVAMDVGSSTGGFTDCMLQNGARKVYSIDVGYGQLDWKLRQDSRVISMERTNIRYVKPEDIGESVDFVSIDVAFISLKLVLPVVKKLLKEDGEIVFLIKPQFEAGREKVGKNGVIRDKETHREVIRNILEFAHNLDLTIAGTTYSPITGPKGNIEFLGFVLNKCPVNKLDFDEIAEHIVRKSHESLK